MPNRIYNKQVTPKGYKRGGGVTDSQKKQNEKNKKGREDFHKKIIGKGKKFVRDTLEGKFANPKRGTAEPRIRKMGGGMMMMERPMMKKGGPSKKPKVRKIGALGVGKAKDFPGIKEIIKMNKQGRKRFKAGGALKPVDPKTQKGLSKLPTEVRNKMGYMKKGGKVNGK
jgi:hypothetical protein